MRLLQSVNGKLILLTTQQLHALAHFIRQMEGVPHHGEGVLLNGQQLQQWPEIRMEDRVATGDIEIG